LGGWYYLPWRTECWATRQPAHKMNDQLLIPAIDVARFKQSPDWVTQKMKRCYIAIESNLLGFALSRRLEATLANCICEILYQFMGVFPPDTRICNA
jgi:hypothetical protein